MWNAVPARVAEEPTPLLPALCAVDFAVLCSVLPCVPVLLVWSTAEPLKFSMNCRKKDAPSRPPLRAGPFSPAARRDGRGVVRSSPETVIASKRKKKTRQAEGCYGPSLILSNKQTHRRAAVLPPQSLGKRRKLSDPAPRKLSKRRKKGRGGSKWEGAQHGIHVFL